MHQRSKKTKSGSVLYSILLFLLLAVFCVSLFFVARYALDSLRQESRYDELAAIVDAAKTAPPPESPSGPVQTEDAVIPPVTDVPEAETAPPTQPPILPEYAPVYELNPDMAGWISIENSRINYPVMQTPNDPDYYLHRNFDRKDSSRGCIYADEKCDLTTPSDNVTLYGHNMMDGSMFAALLNYTHSSYWESHRYIRFDTLTEYHTYEIFAVFATSASVGKGFRYHTFVDAENQQDFDDFVSQCISLSLYDTGIVPEYGDKLLCLSTCEYSHDNGRLVVVAVRTE